MRHGDINSPDQRKKRAIQQIFELVQEATDKNLEIKKIIASYYLEVIRPSIAEHGKMDLNKMDLNKWEDRAFNRSRKFLLQLAKEYGPQTLAQFSALWLRMRRIGPQAGFTLLLDEETWTYIFQELVKDN